MSWIFITVLVIAGFLIMKIAHLKHRFFMVMIILLALFLYTTMSSVADENNLNFSNTQGVFEGIKLYSGWLANGFQNLKVLTGNVIGMDWKKTDGKFIEENKDKKNS
jgi:hypothetical protein